MIYHDIKNLIGQTPMFEIKGFDIPQGSRILAKLEMFNPGGSIKDRLGKNIIEVALKQGKINYNTTIIEPTAGSTGIGIALSALTYGIKTIFIVPAQFSQEKLQLMQALGAQIIHTEAEKGMQGAIQKAKALHAEIPNSYLPLQFENELNPQTYYETLGPEIMADLDHTYPTAFIAGAGSGGTFSGVAKYLKELNPEIKTSVVEPVGSILGGGEPGPHATEGIGMEFIPHFMKPQWIDQIHTIADQEAFYYTRELAKQAGLLVGSSSGAAFAGALKEVKHLPKNSTVVTIFPDSSERYLSKDIYKGAE